MRAVGERGRCECVLPCGGVLRCEDEVRTTLLVAPQKDIGAYESETRNVINLRDRSSAGRIKKYSAMDLEAEK